MMKCWSIFLNLRPAWVRLALGKVVELFSRQGTDIWELPNFSLSSVYRQYRHDRLVTLSNIIHSHHLLSWLPEKQLGWRSTDSLMLLEKLECLSWRKLGLLVESCLLSSTVWAASVTISLNLNRFAVSHLSIHTNDQPLFPHFLFHFPLHSFKTWHIGDGSDFPPPIHITK